MPKTLEEHFLLSEIQHKARENFGKTERLPYRTHSFLLTRAEYMKRRFGDSLISALPKPTVSAFGEWVYWLYNGSFRDEKALRIRTAAESEIKDRLMKEIEEENKAKFRARMERISRIAAENLEKNKKIIVPLAAEHFEKAGWNLYYDGTANSSAEAKVISALEVDGEPVTAKPDLVFQDGGSGDFLIVELKTWERGSQGKLPPFGWPNLKVQLWCYGKIGWPCAPNNIYLQGLVWELRNGCVTDHFHVLEPWHSNDPRVHKESLELFEAFGGRYAEEGA
jgi:hypothetical protein